MLWERRRRWHLVMVDRLVGNEERELFVASSTRIDGATASTPLGQS